MTPHCLSAMISVVIGTLRAFAGGESICQRLSMEGVLRGSFLPMAYKVIIREVLEKEILVDETEAKSEREAIAIVRDRYRKASKRSTMKYNIVEDFNHPGTFKTSPIVNGHVGIISFQDDTLGGKFIENFSDMLKDIKEFL